LQALIKLMPDAAQKVYLDFCLQPDAFEPDCKNGYTFVCFSVGIVFLNKQFAEPPEVEC
jgi:hypothetical protein